MPRIANVSILRLLRILLLLACGIGVLATAVAQAPTADQMEIFRNLPADQQKAILESMGSAGTDGVIRDKDLPSPSTVRQRTESRRTAEGAQAGDGTEPSEYVLAERRPRIAGLDTVLLEMQIRPASRGSDEADRLQLMQERILKSNPYKLDSDGVLRITGVGPIALAGLTAEQASERLNRDPALSEFWLKLTLLPLAKLDSEALKPFGYDLFAGVPSTFAPVTDVPVPAEYVVGPGDRLEVQLIGNTKGRYSLVVNRDGRVMFPELGPIAVSGMRFEEAKARIEARVTDQIIGTQAVVTMGDLRSIRVFVLGEAERPGSYTVGGLATVTNALFASGGVTRIGSLRNIQLKRSGAIVQRLDLYDLLMNGDTSDDVRLLPGDVIFIPPVGMTVGVTGQIRRPAIYELKGESTAADLLYLGGGLLPEADPRLAKIERIDEKRDRVVLDVDLTNPQARSLRLKSGDLLRIQGVRPTYANSVRLDGHVHRPNSFQYRSGMRLTDLLPSVDELKPNADLHYVLIRREQPGSRQIQALSADLERALRAPSTDANPLLAPRDQVFVFDVAAGRRQYLAPVVEQLKMQGTSTYPSQIVRVAGRVRAAGEYPLEPGMTVSALIRAGGGMDEDAFGGEAELARYEVRDGQTRKTEVVRIDLARALAGDASADLRLNPFDFLVVKEISEWAQQETVRLEGEVRFPGEYPIERGESLRRVVARAGGLTTLAFPGGSVFTRDSLKERERQQIKILTDRLRKDLSTLALQGAQVQGQAATQASETLAIGQSLLSELSSAEPVGRLVIDLDRVLAATDNSPDDVILKGGDRLRVPKKAQEVTVIGEVQNATSHLYDPALSRDDYLRLSGGTTKKADDKRIYVVRANGSVDAARSSGWFHSNHAIQPGDTIVVPLDAERMRPLPLWTAVTTILYNIAVAVAAVNSF